MHIVYLGCGREGYVSLRSKTVSWRSINISFWNGKNLVGLGYSKRLITPNFYSKSFLFYFDFFHSKTKISKLIFILYLCIFANFNIKPLFLQRRSSVMSYHGWKLVSAISHIKPYLTILQLWLYPVDICHFETETKFNLFYV